MGASFYGGDVIFPRNTGHQVKGYKMTRNEVLNEKSISGIKALFPEFHSY